MNEMNLNQNELSQKRVATVMNPHTGLIIEYRGDQVYSVRENGLVISPGTGSMRTFYPWNRITSFMYDTRDAVARKAIQGF